MEEGDRRLGAVQVNGSNGEGESKLRKRKDVGEW